MPPPVLTNEKRKAEKDLPGLASKWSLKLYYMKQRWGKAYSKLTDQKREEEQEEEWERGGQNDFIARVTRTIIGNHFTHTNIYIYI